MTDTSNLKSDYSVDQHGWQVIVAKIFLLLGLLYLFILSITLLGGAFKHMGKGFAEAIFQSTSNPVIALMIGVMTTAIVQSSSTTTSIIVGLVAVGSGPDGLIDGTQILTFEAAIPMIMGANIGTSVTNILVSLGHITRGEEFRRAFTGSMLHDFFNVCAVSVLLPLEIYFGIISKSAKYLESMFTGFGGMTFISPLKMITKPISNGIISMTGDSGVISAAIAMAFLFLALFYIVKVLKSLVLSKVEKFFQRYIFRTPVLSFVLGIILTAFVQSSSITTSLVVPLIGAGVISIVQVYPYLLGANVGTTITAFLASFVTGSHVAIALAFSHLMFNVFGIAIFWPLKAIPIWMAEKLSYLTQKSKFVPILYVVIVFFIIPGSIIYFYR